MIKIMIGIASIVIKLNSCVTLRSYSSSLTVLVSIMKGNTEETMTLGRKYQTIEILLAAEYIPTSSLPTISPSMTMSIFMNRAMDKQEMMAGQLSFNRFLHRDIFALPSHIR